MSFDSVYGNLPNEQRDRVDLWLAACCAARNGAQVADNLRNEKQMDNSSMKQLLLALDPENVSDSDYDKLCLNYLLKGKAADVPEDKEFYRVIEEKRFAMLVSENGNGDDSDYNSLMEGLRKKKSWILKKAREGYLSERFKVVVWATFFVEAAEDFFEQKTMKAGDIANILGLGYMTRAIKNQEGCVCYKYNNNALNTVVTPRVPTVADAGFYHFFRPSLEEEPKWGRTMPLDGDVSGGRPEIVHENQSASILLDVDYIAV